MEHTEVKYLGGMKFQAVNRKHSVTIDLPKEKGGMDEGPTPPELFIDSLASCVGVYVLMFCKSTGLNPEGMAIDISWEKQHQEKPYYIKTIDIKIKLPKAEIGPRKEALLKAAYSCLIHATIEKHPTVNIELV